MTTSINPIFCTDGYKLSHHRQYPKGTTLVYSNFTPRSNKWADKGCDKVVVFGIQYAVQQVKEMFDAHFFSVPSSLVRHQLEEELSMYVGSDYNVDHMMQLHGLGYLPIEVRAIDEGAEVPMRVPVLTIHNTLPEFFWVTNFLETILSNLLWLPMTSATTAMLYRRTLEKYAKETDPENLGFVSFQAHDFSMRGMGGLDATIASGLGHAAVFSGSDNLPVIPAARMYYDHRGFFVGGVPATEHSVMCAGSKDGEIETFSNLLDEFPEGILSVVSDTWDLWKVCTEYLPALKDKILSRNGKLVIRPDSGDPVDIICGRDFSEDDYTAWDENILYKKDDRFFEMDTIYGNYPGSEDYDLGEEWTVNRQKGVIELLWGVFGGTVNEQGYKVLDPHIGCIYGDSITPERAEKICERLKAKGFASTNIVLGIGSYTYQYKTRDTFGFALKATYVEINGEGREIFKDPVTDSGVKKSARGLLKVAIEDDEYTLIDGVTWDEAKEGELKPMFRDGQFIRRFNMNQVRENVTRSV